VKFALCKRWEDRKCMEIAQLTESIYFVVFLRDYQRELYDL
jgi:hypothetical protein